MLKAIFFDLDDTLLWDKKSVSEAFKATCTYAEQKCGVNPEALEAEVRKAASELYATYETYAFTQNIGINPFEGLWGDFGDGTLEFPQMNKIVPGYRKEAWTVALSNLGVEDKLLGASLAERFPEERRRLPFVYEETFTVLEQLKGKYKLLLLTNGSPELQQTKLTITPEIAPYFDHIIISGAFGKGKPDAGIFEHALDAAGVGCSEALMVGDNLMTDILGSNRAGIRNVWINREGKQRNEVEPTYEIGHLEELFTILENWK